MKSKLLSRELVEDVLYGYIGAVLYAYVTKLWDIPFIIFAGAFFATLIYIFWALAVIFVREDRKMNS